MKKLFYTIMALSIAITPLTSCNHKEAVSVDPEFMGYIESTQVNVTTRIPGKIISIEVDEGDSVKEGQVVAELDKREILASRNSLLSRLANLVKNKKRLENLYQAGAIAEQKLDEIQTNYDVLKNNLLALDARLEDMTIVSPVNGVVSVRVLEPGQMMPPGMPVVIVTDTSQNWARFSIPEKYLTRIDLGQKFILKTAVKGLQYKGRVIQIMPMTDFAAKKSTTLRGERDLRSFDIKLKITHPGKPLKPGMYIYMTLQNLNNQPES